MSRPEPAPGPALAPAPRAEPRPALALRDVAFAWPGAGRGRGGFGLRCPDFSLAQGESVLLLGASGSGKSTLLSLICGIVAADAGVVAVAGTDLRGKKKRRN